MQKIILTISLFFSFVIAYAQQTLPVDAETKQALIKEVVDVPGAKQAELYDRAMAWINKFYSNPTGMVQTKNPETGEIVGKAQFKINSKDKKGVESYDGMVAYTITLNLNMKLLVFVGFKLPIMMFQNGWIPKTNIIKKPIRVILSKPILILIT